jgi:uncharacterized protein (TIGR02996 family)
MPERRSVTTTQSAAQLEGEAGFLTAVVADMRDDVAKGIYADWLEERGDPRGPFLREFVKAAKRKGKPRLPPTDSFPSAWRHVVGVTLIERMFDQELVDHKEALLTFARPAVVFSLTPADKKRVPIGASRFGGRPDLPAGLAWPTAPPPGPPYRPRQPQPLVFIGQFRLADFLTTQAGRELPREGLLSFFVVDDSEGNVVGNESWEGVQPVEWAVVYSPDLSALRRRESPAGVPTRPSCSLAFMETLDLPEGEVLGIEPDQEDGLANLKHYLREDAESGTCPHRLLGYAQPGVLCGDPTPPGWRHLATFLPEDRNGWYWADEQLMFFINEDDLRNGRFDRVTAVNG